MLTSKLSVETHNFSKEEIAEKRVRLLYFCSTITRVWKC